MILRMRGIELGASEDDGFWQEQGGSVRGAELPVDDDETLLMQSYSNSYRLRIIHLMLACLLLEQALIDAWLGSNPCRQLR